MNASGFVVFVALHVLLLPVSYASKNYSDNARIQCGNNNVTNNEYFFAANDMEAKKSCV